MNPTRKKFISLFLVFSIMMLSTNLYAKERRGAKLRVTKLDGQQIEGELITVKPNSLLLLNNEGKDVSVDIADIKVIRVVKKWWRSAGYGAFYGGLIGLGGGALIGYAMGDDPPEDFSDMAAWQKAIFYGISFMCIGWFIGGIIGLIAGKDKKIQLEGMSDSEIQETLDKLRKKARVCDYK